MVQETIFTIFPDIMQFCIVYIQYLTRLYLMIFIYSTFYCLLSSLIKLLSAYHINLLWVKHNSHQGIFKKQLIFHMRYENVMLSVI